MTCESSMCATRDENSQNILEHVLHENVGSLGPGRVVSGYAVTWFLYNVSDTVDMTDPGTVHQDCATNTSSGDGGTIDGAVLFDWWVPMC